MQSDQGPKSNRRSNERVAIPPDAPVFLEVSFNELPAKLLIEDLSLGGALLICPDIAESLDVGQSIPSVLILPNGKVRVDATVRWRLWPRVGVQFDGISSEDRAQIAQLIESICAKV